MVLLCDTLRHPLLSVVPSVVLLAGDGVLEVGPSGKWRWDLVGSLKGAGDTPVKGTVGLKTLPHSPLLPGWYTSNFCYMILATGPDNLSSL